MKITTQLLFCGCFCGSSGILFLDPGHLESEEFVREGCVGHPALVRVAPWRVGVVGVRDEGRGVRKM